MLQWLTDRLHLIIRKSAANGALDLNSSLISHCFGSSYEGRFGVGLLPDCKGSISHTISRRYNIYMSEDRGYGGTSPTSRALESTVHRDFFYWFRGMNPCFHEVGDM